MQKRFALPVVDPLLLSAVAVFSAPDLPLPFAGRKCCREDGRTASRAQARVMGDNAREVYRV
jgi:hypothetical protein